MNTIPANQLVNVLPSVVGTGGSALSLNGVFLTTNESLPAKSVTPFATKDDVKTYFGVESDEYAAAAIYFKGFDGSNVKPGKIYFATYLATDVEAWTRGNSLNLNLAQLKALSGSLSIDIDGTTKTAANINLSAATSFANAATIIGTAISANVTYDEFYKAFVIRSNSEVVSASTIDFATGTLAESLLLTKAKGAILSQGAAADTPASAMDNVTQKTQNWGTFTTLFEPDSEGKVAYAKWTNDQDQRYAYVMWDTDIQATQVDGESVGAYLTTMEFDGTIPVYGDLDKGAFVCGTAASIDFTEFNGRITFAFKGQAGIVPNVTDATMAQNLISNGYNFYGAYATATEQFNLFQNGQITGVWRWADAYINQIYLNSQLQLSILNMLKNLKSLPYNNDGYGLIRAACLDPIKEGLNFGSIRTGIPLSEEQKAEINSAAGMKIDEVLANVGWYLQIVPATAQIRGNRTSPPMKLWYTDGGSIQKIDLASIDVM
ncbi:DUF3383 domain-containing protein [Acinetobacter courvalinii]|uniref:DUF3383 domain-containing protein n=1 Tax=Acinetobacter courvalinii TaxID=280147 RepID=UPI0021CE3683|nr:DUF3383 domain-containing protein [Acinetobacter courvalinii]MCU4576131.1 DUF3383 domain-containing protein [Acinetobacter courvalinii]